MYKIIKCPKCNYEYLPGEIFDPKYFLGQPKDIVRNSIGEVLGFEGIEQDLTETFTCSNCGNEFDITAKLTFTIGADDSETFVPTSLF